MISSSDEYFAALPGQRFDFHRADNGVLVERYASLWRQPGYPGTGAIPTTGNGAIPTSATTGALNQGMTNASPGGVLQLGGFDLGGQYAIDAWLIDRLFHNSGLAWNGGVQSWTQPALTRPDADEGGELWLESYAGTILASTTITLSYTNQDGVAGQLATAAVVNPFDGEMIPCRLAAGDRRVRSVEGITIAGGAAAGDFGVVILRTLAKARVKDAERVLLELNGPQIYDDSCLALVVLGEGAGSGDIRGSLTALGS